MSEQVPLPSLESREQGKLARYLKAFTIIFVILMLPLPIGTAFFVVWFLLGNPVPLEIICALPASALIIAAMMWLVYWKLTQDETRKRH